jgi:hypothetical protein
MPSVTSGVESGGSAIVIPAGTAGRRTRNDGRPRNNPIANGGRILRAEAVAYVTAAAGF